MAARRAAALAFALLLAGCGARAAIVADRAPPPAPVEAAPRARTGYVWVRGDWEWSGSAWHWREGRWQRSRGNEYEWIDGHWERRGERYQWIEGRWQRVAAGGGGRDRVIIHDHGGH